MEEKRLKQFTFYDLYYEALKGLPDEAAGRMAENPQIKKRFICFENTFAGRGELDETGLRAGEKRL